MEQYQNIYQILKECAQKPRTQIFQLRAKKFKLQKDRLVDMLDFERIEKIQQSVDQRMGPKLCDNSEQESRQIKQSFLSILEDYKREITSTIKSQKGQNSKLILAIEEQLEALLSQFVSSKKQVEEKIQQQKKRYEQINLICKQMAQLSTQDLEKQLKAIEHELEVEMLQKQLAQRKRFSNITSIMSSIHLIP